MSVISRTPSATSRSASDTTDSNRRERNLPRRFGITQKLQGWSQPSAILIYADELFVVRRRGVVWSYRYWGSWAAAPSHGARENLPCSSRRSPSGRNVGTSG